MFRLACVFVFLAALICHPLLVCAGHVRVVSLTGEPAPGTDVQFGSFHLANFDRLYTFNHAPAINDSGQIAFQARLEGTGVESSNDTGYWIERNGTLTKVVREGDQPPETIGRFGTFAHTVPWLSNHGQLAFRGSITPGGGAIWSWDEGVVETNLRWGYLETGELRGVRSTSAPIVDHLGDIIIHGYYTITGDVLGTVESGIWADRPSGLEPIATTGSAAPNTNSVFTFISYPVVNNSGTIAFLGHTLDEAGSSVNDFGIWVEVGGALSTLVQTGDHAPGTDGVFATNGRPALSDSSKFLFGARIEGLGIAAENDTGLWSGDLGSLALVVREGDNAPGTSAVFSEFASTPNPTISNSGYIAFIGRIRGPDITANNDHGIWVKNDGALALVAREGDLAPETNGVFQALATPQLNNEGQLAFVGRIEGVGIDQDNDDGIWATNVSGDTVIVAREGAQIDVDAGPNEDLRTIKRLGFIPSHGFNDSGQIAFTARFTDGSSGVFVSNLVAIPEPPSLLLIASALPILHRLAACRVTCPHK